MLDTLLEERYPIGELMTVEEIKKNIENILNQFVKEELGNRLSQFAFIGLRSLIMGEVDKLKEIPKE